MTSNTTTALKTQAVIRIDFAINEQIKSALRLKRLTNGSEMIKEDAMGQMVEERYALEQVLTDKGINFPDLLKLLNKK